MRTRLLAQLTICASWLFNAAPGHTVSFTPYPCSTSTWTEVFWTLSSNTTDKGYEIDEPLFQQTAGGTVNYANNIKNPRHFLASRYVRYLEIYATYWYTWSTDYLRLQQSGTGTVYDLTYNTGTPFWYSTTLINYLQARGLDMTFTTNTANTRSGFNISKVRVKCQSAPGDSTPWDLVIPHERYTGILLARDDIVNFKSQAAPANQSLNIALWAPVSPYRDVDLYVRCGALPTPTTYTVASKQYGVSTEYVRLTSAQCSQPSTVYITVHNRETDKIPFDLMVSVAKDSSFRNLKVAVEGATATDLTNVRSTMAATARQFYGLTEGQMLLKDIAVTAYPTGAVPYYNGSNWGAVVAACQAQCSPVNCDICFYRAPGGGANASTGLAVINLLSWSDADVVTHELHHSILGINWDEYDWDPSDMCGNCGHSISSNSWSRSNNLCNGPTLGFTNHPRDPYYKPDLVTLCSPDTHVSGWTGETVGLYDPNGVTPDIYNFAGHSFNSAIYVH